MQSSRASANNLVFQTVTFQGNRCYFPLGVLAVRVKGITKLNRFDRNLKKTTLKVTYGSSNSPSHLHFMQLFQAHFSQSKAFVSSASLRFVVLSQSLYKQTHEVICLLKLTTSCFSKPQGHLWWRQSIIRPHLVHLCDIRPACWPQPFLLTSTFKPLGAWAQQAKKRKKKFHYFLLPSPYQQY